MDSASEHTNPIGNTGSVESWVEARILQAKNSSPPGVSLRAQHLIETLLKGEFSQERVPSKRLEQIANELLAEAPLEREP